MLTSANTLFCFHYKTSKAGRENMKVGNKSYLKWKCLWWWIFLLTILKNVRWAYLNLPWLWFCMRHCCPPFLLGLWTVRWQRRKGESSKLKIWGLWLTPSIFLWCGEKASSRHSRSWNSCHYDFIKLIKFQAIIFKLTKFVYGLCITIIGQYKGRTWKL